MLKHILSLLLTGVLLTACTSGTERPTNVKYIDNNSPIWLVHLQKIKQIKQYSVSGQIGYISSKVRFSTHFDWRYNNPKSYSLKFSSLLSSSTLQLEMSSHGLTVSDEKGRQRTESDAKQLLSEIVGMEFPLQQFAYWLKGQPEDNRYYQIGENHLLATFTYPIDGQAWTADYLTYYDNLDPKMPRDILLKNQKQTLKIRINEWKF